MTLKYFVIFVSAAVIAVVNQRLYGRDMYGLSWEGIIEPLWLFWLACIPGIIVFARMDDWLLARYKSSASKTIVQRKNYGQFTGIVTATAVIGTLCVYPYFTYDAVAVLKYYVWFLIVLLLSALIAVARATKVDKDRNYEFWRVTPLLWDTPHQTFLPILYLVAIAAFFTFTGSLTSSTNLHQIIWTIPNLFPYEVATWIYRIWSDAIFFGDGFATYAYMAIPIACVIGTIRNVVYALKYETRDPEKRYESIIKDIP